MSITRAFIAITPRSTLIRSGNSIFRIPSMGQIDLCINYSYLIKLYFFWACLLHLHMNLTLFFSITTNENPWGVEINERESDTVV